MADQAASVLPRIHSYPVLAKNSLDYLPEFHYKIKHRRSEDRNGSFIVVGHEISEGNLVAELVSKGKAAFACTLTSAHSAYREVFVEDKNRDLKYDQKLVWDDQKVVFPLLFQPAVVALREIDNLYLGGTGGVHSIWRGSTVSFPKGSVLAIAPFWQSQNTLQSLLRIRKSQDLPPGCYEVKEAEVEGFYFLVEAHPELFESLRNPGKSPYHRDSIYTAALAEGFRILQSKFGKGKEEDWKNHHNLRSLDAEMKRKSIVPWYEEDFSANRAAAMFHPHKIDTGNSLDG